MIQDSLKTIRTTHRLILGVGAATLAFAFSLREPKSEAAWLASLKNLRDLPLGEYEAYVATESKKAWSWEGYADTETALERASTEAGVLGAHHITEALGRPLHIGRILTQDLAWSSPDSAPLLAIQEALNLEDLDRPVQILVPNGTSFANRIEEFIRNETSTGMYVDSVQLGPPGQFGFNSSFVEGTNGTLPLYFEARPPGGGAAPVLNDEIPYTAVDLDPETSLRSWLSRRAETKGLWKEHSDGTRLFSELPPIDIEWQQSTLGELRKLMSERIAEASPENRKLSILTLSVPGSLTLLAVPISLIALMLHMLSHARHLKSLAMSRADGAETAKELRTFSWIPLRGGAEGTCDVRLTLWALPPIACVTLLWRVWSFGTPSGLSIATMLGACVATAFLGKHLDTELGVLRRRVHYEPWPESPPVDSLAGEANNAS